MSDTSTTSTSQPKCLSNLPQNTELEFFEFLPSSSSSLTNFNPQEALKIEAPETETDKRSQDDIVMNPEETFPEFTFEGNHQHWQTIQPSNFYSPTSQQHPIQSHWQRHPEQFPKLPPLNFVLPQYPVDKQTIAKQQTLLLQECKQDQPTPSTSKPPPLTKSTSLARPPVSTRHPPIAQKQPRFQLIPSAFQRYRKPEKLLHQRKFLKTTKDDEVDEKISLTITRTDRDVADFDIPSPFAPNLGFGQYDSLVHSISMLCDIIDYANASDRDRFCNFFRRSMVRQYERIVEPLSNNSAEVSEIQKDNDSKVF
jgi:hypothetical protein